MGKYAPEQLEEALEDVAKGYSFRPAAETHSTLFTTVRENVNGKYCETLTSCFLLQF